MIVEELVALLGFDLKGEADLRRFQSGLNSARRGLVSFAGAATRFAAVATGAIAAGTAALGKSAISTGADFEDLQAILETVEGSAEKARKSLDWVEDFATKTPYDLKQVADSFKQLRAYGLDPTSGLLRSVGDASSAMGKSLMQGVEAVADAVRGENERLKEFGIVASVAGQKVTYSWSQNGKNMTKTVNKNAEEIQAALEGIFDAKFFGAMEKRSKTFRGIVANIGDMWTKFNRKIADAGFFEWFKGQFKGILDTLNEFAADGTLDRVAREISDTLIYAGEELKSLFSGVTVESIKDGIIGIVDAASRIVSFGSNIKKAIQGVGEFIGSLIGLKEPAKGVYIVLFGILALIRPWWAAFAFMLYVVEDFITYLEGGKSVIGDVIDWIKAKIESLFGIDLNDEQLTAKLANLSGALGSFSVGIGLIIGIVALKKLASGIIGLAAALKGGWIFRVLMLAGAISVLFGAFSGVQSFEDFNRVIGDLSAVDWAMIAAGVASVAGPLASLAGAMTKIGGNSAFLKAWPLAAAAGVVAGTKYVADTMSESNARENRRLATPRQAERDSMYALRSNPHDIQDAIDDRYTGESVLTQRIEGLTNIISKLNTVAGPGAAEAAAGTVTHDQRTYNTENTVNAPVTVHAQTNASPQAIGDAAASKVSAAGSKLTRSMSVTANPGTAGP